MPLLVFTLILLSILLLLINKISNKYLESFRSDISCKKNPNVYKPTCDKKKIYDILSNMETEISKIKYNVIREKTKSANYDFDEMYNWYKKQSNSSVSSAQKNREAAAAYAKKKEAEIKNVTKAFEKKNRSKFAEYAKKNINLVKAFKF